MKFFRDLRIAAKLSLIFIVVGFTLTIIAGIIIVNIVTNYAVSERKDCYVRQADMIMHEIDVLMNEYAIAIQCLAQDEIFFREGITPAQIGAYLEKRKQGHGIDSLSYFNAERIRLCDTDGIGIGNQQPLLGFWRDVLLGNMSIGSDIRMGPERKKGIIYFAAPIMGKDNNLKGALVIRLGVENIKKILLEHVQKGAYLALFDRDRYMISSTRPDFENKILKEKIPLFDSVKEVLGNKDGAVFEYQPLYRKHFFTAYVREKGYENFKGNDWSLIICIYKEEIYAPIKNLLITIVSVLLIIALIVMIFIPFWTETISRPLREITQKMRNIIKGEKVEKADYSSGDEIGQLGVAFDELLEYAKKTGRALLVREAYLEAALAGIDSAAFICGQDNKIVRANRTALDMLGLSAEELSGSDSSLLFSGKEALEKEINAITDLDIIVISGEYRIMAANNFFLQKHLLSKEEVIGRHCYKISHGFDNPCQPPDCTCPLEEALYEKGISFDVHEHLSREGNKEQANIFVLPITSKKEKNGYFLHLSAKLTDEQGNHHKKILQSVQELADRIGASSQMFEGLSGFSGLGLGKIISEGPVNKLEMKMLNKKGESIPVYLSAKAIYADNNKDEKKVVGVIAVAVKARI